MCLSSVAGKPLRLSITSPEEVVSTAFQEEIGRLARQMRATNMSLEGEFAANIAAAPSSKKATGAERLSYVGHLNWMSVFMIPRTVLHSLAARNLRLCFT